MGKARVFLLTSCALGVVGFLNAYAQDYGDGSGGGANLNQQINNLDSQFGDAIREKQNELVQAQASLQQCAMDAQNADNQVEGQKAQNDGARKAGAAQKALPQLPNLVGPLVNAITGNGNQQGKYAQQQIKNIQNEAADLNDTVRTLGGPQKIVSPSGMGVDYSRSQIQHFCSNLNSELSGVTVTQGDCAAPLPTGVDLQTYFASRSDDPEHERKRKAAMKCYALQQSSWVSDGMSQPISQGYGGGYGYGYTPPGVGSCIADIKDRAETMNMRMLSAAKDVNAARNIASDGIQKALGAAANTLGAGMDAGLGAHADNQAADAQKKSNDLNRQACENAAKMQIDGINKAIQDLANKRSRALLDAQLQAAAANQRNLGQPGNFSTIPGSSAVGGTVAVGQPENLGGGGAGAGPAPASAGGGAGTGNGLGAGSAGGGGGGGGVDWTFGAGGGQGGSPPAGSLESANWNAVTGGGGGGGGDFGFGSEPIYDQGQGSGGKPGSGSTVAMNDGAKGFGDGGIMVLLIKARNRLGDHAPELTKSLNFANKIATSPSSPKRQ